MSRAADIAKVAGEVAREPRLPSNFDLAWRYAENGVPVFPVHPRTKVPAKGTHGHHDATTNLGRICRLWAGRREGWAVAIPGGDGVVCLDEDRCGDVRAALGSVPEGCLVIDTPSPCKRDGDHACGGRHHYLFAGDARKLEAQGVEVKGQGAYFLAPWTARSDGHYRVTHWHRHPVEAPLPASLYREPSADTGHSEVPALDSLPRMIAPNDARAVDALAAACEAIAEQAEGYRRPTMHREAYQVGKWHVGAGRLDPQAAMAALCEAADVHDDAGSPQDRYRQVQRGLATGAANTPAPQLVADVNRRVSLWSNAAGTVAAKDHAAGKKAPVWFPGKRYPKWENFDKLPAFQGQTVTHKGNEYDLGHFWWHSWDRRDRAYEGQREPHEGFVLKR
jgi:hypothetical protein